MGISTEWGEDYFTYQYTFCILGFLLDLLVHVCSSKSIKNEIVLDMRFWFVRTLLHIIYMPKTFTSLTS